MSQPKVVSVSSDDDPHQIIGDLIFGWAPVNSNALLHAFIASFSVIIVSELGDKTFIITAIMAMKNSRLLVFLSSSLALLCMTMLSVGMGVAVTLIPKLYTHYGSIVLFLCFGLKMLHEAFTIEEGSEAAEIEESLEQQKAKWGQPVEKQEADSRSTNTTISSSAKVSKSLRAWFRAVIKPAPLIINVFTMIFLAEWGDRSQISTVILAAREDAVGVFFGSLIGHVLCTGLAVVCGRIIADVISVRTMTFLGGCIFLFFAIFAIASDPEA